MLLMSVGLVWYLNFRYGASQRPELAVPREVGIAIISFSGATPR